MKKIIFLISAFFLSNNSLLFSQVAYDWANSMGSTSHEYGQAIATDPSGNVYIAGSFSNTVDFDPSAATANLTGFSGTQDIFLAKYSASGAFIWVKQIGGTNDERPLDLVADASGAYLAGIFKGTVDFDPSASTNNITSLGGGTDGDGFFAKYDVNGALVWVNRIGSTANDRLIGIAVDASQNVFITGFIGANTDMDPSAAIVTFPVSGTYNAYFGKYSSTGAYVFAKQITGGYTEGDDIAIDASGNIYLTGSFALTNDFNPSAATNNLSTSSLTQADIFLAKYDATGNYVFAKQIGGNGVDIGFQVMPDASGNIYLGGVFSTTCDFDPTAAVSSLTSAGNGDLFVAKYTSAGNLTWVNGTGGTSNDYVYGMGLDASNNVYITGKFQGSNIDFDPSAATNALSATSSCIYLAGYDASGAYLFTYSPGNIASESRGMVVNTSVYMTGMFYSTADFDFGAATANFTSVGSADIFFAKYNICSGTPPAQPSSIVGTTTLCVGSAQIYSVTNDANASAYAWSFPNGWTGASTTNTISVSSGTSGNITVAASNSCGLSPNSTLSVTVGGFTNSAISATNVTCNGSSNGKAIFTYTGGIAPLSFLWMPSSQNTATLTNVGPNTYTVTISDSYLCTSQNTVLITQPNPLVITTNTVVNAKCFGTNTGTINTSINGGNPAYTILWASTSSVTPAANAIANNIPIGTYTLSVNDTKGCNTQSVYVINQAPALTIASTNTTYACNSVNGSASVSIAGGTSPYSYFWNAPLTQTVNNIVGVNSGNYTITTTDNNGCMITKTLSIPSSTLPVVSAMSNTAIICAGTTVNLTANGAITYTWNNAANSTMIQVTPTVNSSYTVTGSNAQGCAAQATISITVNPLPVLNVVTNNSVLCAGSIAELTASGANSYTWNTSSNSNTITINPSTTTSYTVSGTNANGCVSSSTFVQTVSNCTFLNSISTSAHQISIFPNPFKSYLQISLGEKSTVRVVNAIGQTLLNQQINTLNYTLNTSDFVPGIYFISISNNNSNKTFRVIKGD